MRSSDFLFRLIKALSKGDRRNLKLFGRLQEGDKKYLQLFDAIDAQEDYNEAALLTQFKEERFTNQFSVAKNYLYNYILKTLHIFHKDQHSELGVLLHQIEILMSKNLFDQAQKLLRKAKHVASKRERFQEMLTLLDHERKILHRMERSKEYEVFIQDISAEERQTMQRLANYLEYQHLFDEVYVLTKKGLVGSDQNDRERVQAILTMPLIANPEHAISIRAKLKSLEIQVDSFYYLQDIPNAFDRNRQIIALYEADKEIRIEKNIRYIWSIINDGVYAYRMGLKSEAIASLDKLKAVETFSPEEEVRVFERYFQFKISLCIELGDVEAGLATIRDFEAEHILHEGRIMKSVELGIYYVSAYFYFVAGMPEGALPWINKILNEPRTELRVDLQCMARVLSVLVHLELRNYDLIEYLSKSAIRFLSNRGRLHGLERMVFRHVRRLANLGPSGNENDLFEAFKEDLEIVLEDRFEQKSLNFLDARTWIESKLSHTTMAAIYAKDAAKESTKA